MKSSRRIFYSRIIFITGIILLTSLSILFLYETYQEDTASVVVANTSVTRHLLERVYASLKERESEQRARALAGDSVTTQVLSNELSVAADMHIIDSLISDSQEQKNNLKILHQRIREHDALVRQHGAALTQDIRRQQRTSADSIRKVIVRMQLIEGKLAASRSLDARKHTVLSTLVGTSVSMFSIVVFAIAFYFVDQELKRSQQYIDEKETLNLKIAEINRELEDANRTLHKLNSELKGKNFQLERFASELSSYAHITSHDMQEPLRKIEFFISVIEDNETDRLSDDGRKYLGKIRVSVNRMRQLFLGMLDFSLTNKQDNSLEPVDLNNILKHALRGLNADINDSGAIITSEQLPRIKGIQFQLVQLFENVLRNAIKFRKSHGTPEIKVSFTTVTGNGEEARGLEDQQRYYRIDFADNGIGFDQKYAEKIFGIFQRLRSDGYGIGIGLAISRKIAENHSGILIAQGQPDQGAVFSFFVPIPD